jgi:tRNA(fMet)-specific endonuclease VapC
VDILADTAFLIDLWRESGNPGPAARYARAHAGLQVGICWVVEAEFLCGAALAGQDTRTVAAFLSAYPVVHSTQAAVRAYAELFADLRRRNQLIGPNDLWLAACARTLRLPLLTRNAEEFSRIADLAVIDYKAPPHPEETPP